MTIFGSGFSSPLSPLPNVSLNPIELISGGNPLVPGGGSYGGSTNIRDWNIGGMFPVTGGGGSSNIDWGSLLGAIGGSGIGGGGYDLSGLTNLINSGFGAQNTNFGGLNTSIGGIGNQLNTGFGGLGNQFTTGFGGLSDLINTGFGGMNTNFGGLNTSIGGIGNQLSTGFGGLGNQFTTGFGGLYDLINSGFGGLNTNLGGLSNQFTTGFGGLNTNLGGLSNQFTTGFGGLNTNLGGLGNQLNGLSNQIGSLSSLQGMMGNMGGWTMWDFLGSVAGLRGGLSPLSTGQSGGQLPMTAGTGDALGKQVAGGGTGTTAGATAGANSSGGLLSGLGFGGDYGPDEVWKGIYEFMINPRAPVPADTLSRSNVIDPFMGQWNPLLTKPYQSSTNANDLVAGLTDSQQQLIGQAQQFGQSGWQAPYQQGQTAMQNLLAGGGNSMAPYANTLAKSGTGTLLNSMYGQGTGYQAPQSSLNFQNPSFGFTPQAQRIGFNPSAPQSQLGLNAPQIGFNPSTPQVNWNPGAMSAPTQQALQSVMNPGATNPFLDQMVQNANNSTISQFKQQVLPSIRQSAQGAGQLGGTRQGISEGLALGGLADAMSRNATNMYGSAYQQAQQNVLPAIQTGLGWESGQQSNQLQQALANANLNAGTQQLGADLAKTQAGFGLETQGQALQQALANLGSAGQNNQLLGQLAQANAGYGMDAQNLLAQMQTTQGGWGMQNQANQLQQALANMNMIGQTQALNEQQRAAIQASQLAAAQQALGNVNSSNAFGLNAMTQGLNSLPTLTNLPISTMQSIYSMVSPQQQIQQQMLDAVRNAQLQNYQIPLQGLSSLGNMLRDIFPGAYAFSTGGNTGNEWAKDMNDAAMGWAGLGGAM